MRLILACDPGAKPGYAVVGVDRLGGFAVEDMTSDFTPLETVLFDEAVFEAQHAGASLYRNGRKVRISRKSQETLSFTAGRQFERVRADRKFRMKPDEWRAVLWPGSRRLPKRVVLARLRAEFGQLIPAGATDDAVEALGLAMAWLRVAEKSKKKYEVK